MVYSSKKMEKAEKRKIKITGTGFYVPDKVLTNFDLEKIVDTTDEWIVSRTGIRERRIGSEDQMTSDLAVEAAHKTLNNAGLQVKDIDLILMATSTPDTIFPSTACWVQYKLGADHIPAFDISAGCTGFLYGMILAEGMILSGNNKRILLIGGEFLTKVTNWKDRNIHKYGNVSVATIPIALHELNESGKFKDGTIVVMDAFGAGFTWAAITYRW